MVDRPLRDKLADVLCEGIDLEPEELAEVVLQFLSDEFDRQLKKALGDTLL